MTIIRYKYYANTVISMADNFDKDMKEYLSSRKKSGLFSGMLKEKQPEIRLHPEVEPYEEQPMMQNESEATEAPAESESYEPESYETEPTKKKGFFSRLFGGKTESTPVLASSEMMDDFKRVSKIALALAKQLNPENLETFKRSADYEELKTILKKHNLIK